MPTTNDTLPKDTRRLPSTDTQPTRPNNFHRSIRSGESSVLRSDAADMYFLSAMVVHLK